MYKHYLDLEVLRNMNEGSTKELLTTLVLKFIASERDGQPSPVLTLILLKNGILKEMEEKTEENGK